MSSNLTNVSTITFDDVNQVLQTLKKQKDVLNSAYTKQIASVLESSQACFSVAGLDYSQISDAFNKTFTNLDSNFYSLVDVLENDVLKKYSSLVLAVKEMFNSKFASEMSALLELNTNKKS